MNMSMNFQTKKELMSKHMCPVCWEFEFETRLSHEICEVCGWQDDVFDEDDPNDETGANDLNLNEYRARYEAGWRPEWLDEDGK